MNQYFCVMVMFNGLVLPRVHGISPAGVRLLYADAAVLLAYHVIETYVTAPARYPDLWVVGNCVIGAAHFGLLLLFYYFRLWKQGGEHLEGREKRD